MNKTLYPYLLLCLAPLLWAGNFLLGKIVHNQIPPLTLNFFRWFIVALCLLPFSWKKMSFYTVKIKENFLKIVGLSTLSVVIYPSFIFMGLHHTTVLHTSIINAMVPALIVLFSLLINKTISIQKAASIGMVISFVGVLIVITKGNILGILSAYNFGDFEIVIAVLAWSLYSVLYKRYSLPFPPLFFLFINAIIGTIILLPFFFYEVRFNPFVNYSLLAWGTVGYASLFSSILAFNFWNIGLSKIGADKSAIFFNLLPLFSTILAIALLHEKFYFYHAVGGGLIVLGISNNTIVNAIKNNALLRNFHSLILSKIPKL